MTAFVLLVATGPLLHAGSTVDELPDLTGGVIPLLTPADALGGQLFAGGQLSSRGEVRYLVRVKNQSGDPIEADSLVVVVHKIHEAARARLHDVTARVEIVGADGETGDGKPYFRVPLDGKPELAPYSESEAFTLEILNPDLLRLYPPVLRVRGLRRTASHVFQDALQNLVSQGTITPEEALEAVESAEGRRF